MKVIIRVFFTSTILWTSPILWAASDIDLRMTSTNGSTSIDFQNNSGVTVSSITSSGDVSFVGSLMPAGNPGSNGYVLVSSGPTLAPVWRSTTSLFGAGTTPWNLNGNALSGGEVLGSTNLNPLQFVMNNNPTVVVSTNGFVGIGTTNPISDLHIVPAGEGYVILDRTGNGGAPPVDGGNEFVTRKARPGPLSVQVNDDLGGLEMHGYSTTGFAFGADIGGLVDGAPSAGVVPTAITFRTNGSLGIGERVRITSDGLVGVGTTAPEAYLHVSPPNSGDIRLDAYRDGTHAGNELLVNRARGSRTVPQIVVNDDVLGGMETYGWDGSQFLKGTDIEPRVEGTPVAGSMPAAITFQTNPGGLATVERMRISANGNVGIGNATPGSKLHVSSGVLTIDGTGSGLRLSAGTLSRTGGSEGLSVDAGGNLTLLGVDVNVGDGHLILDSVSVGWNNTGHSFRTNLNSIFGVSNANNLGNASNRNTLVGYGNVLNGTVNTARINLFGSDNRTTGSVQFGTSTLVGYNNTLSAIGNALIFGNNITNNVPDSIMIGLADNAKMTMLSSGYVGIGTTAPGSPLHVAGPLTSAAYEVNASTTLANTQSAIFADASSGALSVTLPAAGASTIGRVYHVYKVDATANAVTIAATGGNTLSGKAGASSATTQWDYIRIIGRDSSSWILTKQ